LTKAIQAPLEPHERIPSKTLDIANTNKPITINVPQRHPVFTLSLPTIGTKHLQLNLLATMSRINMLILPSNNVWTFFSNLHHPGEFDPTYPEDALCFFNGPPYAELAKQKYGYPESAPQFNAILATPAVDDSNVEQDDNHVPPG
jgi:hypothetical protein